MQHRWFSSAYRSHRYFRLTILQRNLSSSSCAGTFSCFCCSLLLIIYSQDCSQNRAADHDANNCTLAKFFREDMMIPKTFQVYSSSLECCWVSSAVWRISDNDKSWSWSFHHKNKFHKKRTTHAFLFFFCFFLFVFFFSFCFWFCFWFLKKPIKDPWRSRGLESFEASRQIQITLLGLP